MSLFQATLAIPNGQQNAREIYKGNFPKWGYTLLQLRGPLAEFLERTLLKLIEDPVEDEITQWRNDLFEKMQENISSMDIGYQQMPYPPREWYTAFRICLNQELEFVNAEWRKFADAELQRCFTLFQQIQFNAAQILYDFPEMIGIPSEQDLLVAMNNLVETTSKCVLALLEYKTDFRPYYFSNMSTEFASWRDEYRARLQSIQQIRIFMQDFHEKHFEQEVNRFSLRFSEQIGRMRTLSEKVDMAMTKLVSQAMIVTKKPKQTTKKETNFELEVKIIGNELVHVNEMEIPSKGFINESQVENLHRHGLSNEIFDGYVEIENHQPRARPPRKEYNEADKTMTVIYQGLRISKRPNVGLDSTDVLKQKFVILFHVELQFDGVPIRVWAVSSPLVFTTHVNQDCDVAANRFWEVYVLYKSPFNVVNEGPTKVWQVRAALSRYIKNETNISWELNHLCLNFLMDKILGRTDSSPNDPVDRDAIDENIDRESKVTFWEWFMGCMKLLKHELSALWRDGYIVGFIHREIAEKIVDGYSVGTFLMRISSSEVGELVITSKDNESIKSGVLPRNGGMFVDKVDNLILGMQGISDLLYFGPNGEFLHSCKDQVFIEIPPDIPDVPVNGRKPYYKLVITLKMQANSMLRRIGLFR